MALPDCHSGYGFAIGNVAAFDMADPESIVSPGGVGFDINCGVRLLRTNLTEVHFDTLDPIHTLDWPVLICLALTPLLDLTGGRGACQRAACAVAF